MTDRLDLPRRYRRIVEALLREHVPDAEVWAYGSRVNGESHEGSDLDLVVRGPGLEPLGEGFLNLLEAIEESNIPILVQIHDWARLPESFHQEIDRNHIVMQKGANADNAGLPVGWRELPFSDAVLVNPAVRLERGVTYPFVDMAAVNAGSRSAYSSSQREFRGGGSRFHNGDTLMARITPCLENGKVARYYSPKAISVAHGSTEFIIIRGRPNVTDNDFTYYLTQWDEFREYAVSQMTGTSGRQRVPVNSLDHFTVPVPPLSEQRAIAHVLKTLDDKIELNRQMNETLEAMARTLFKSWFVDFDPVRAKMEGRWRRGESLPGLLAEHYDIFPERLVSSELGEIPKGWGVKTLGKMVNVVGGTTPSTKVTEYWNGGIHCWATPKDLSNLSSPVLLDTERKITDAGLAKIGSGLLPKGTVLFSSRAPIGYLAISEQPVAINQGFIGIPPGDRISNLFLLYWCNAHEEEITNHANGSTFLEISKGSFRRIPMLIPVESVTEAFDRHIRFLHQRIVGNERQAGFLTAQRETLLQKLMCGKLRV